MIIRSGSTLVGEDEPMSKENQQPIVKTFFDRETNTAQHVVFDPNTKVAAILDPVLDFDAASGQTSTKSADAILAYGREQDLDFQWILETHAHADHISAAHVLCKQTGAKTAIGRGIVQVQKHFAPLFGFEDDFACDGSQFDQLLSDGDRLVLGNIAIDILTTPGHTPACVTYHIAGALFVGDTIFMPDVGSARADFPGGDAKQLFRSIQRIYQYPDATKIYLCHDYLAPRRDAFITQTSVGEQKAKNIHVQSHTKEAEFIQIRTQRDQTLSMPKLILPALQINLRAGHLPPVDGNGIAYLKLPLNQF